MMLCFSVIIGMQGFLGKPRNDKRGRRVCLSFRAKRRIIAVAAKRRMRWVHSYGIVSPLNKKDAVNKPMFVYSIF